MEKYQVKNNNAIIFKNSHKISEKHPDYTGTITIVEPLPVGEYALGLYTKQSQKGGTYLVGSIRPKLAPKAKPQNTANNDF